MRKIRLMMLVLGVLLLVSPMAMASYFSITPTGSLDAGAGDTVDFTLTFNNTGGDLSSSIVTGIALNCGFDAGELSFNGISFKSSFSSGWVPLNDGLTNDVYRIDRGNFSGVTLASGANDIATFSFSVINDNAWDGSADFWMLNMVGEVNDFVTFDDFSALQCAAVDGADVGSPAVVPIPGAVWLLGSGLLGLVTIRRRRPKV